MLMTGKPRETQAELHVVELKEKVNNSSLMKHLPSDWSKEKRVLHLLKHKIKETRSCELSA